MNRNSAAVSWAVTLQLQLSHTCTSGCVRTSQHYSWVEEQVQQSGPYLLFTETPPTPHSGSSSSLPDADGGERMSEGGAVPSQDGAGRGSDGEGLAASPHEEPQSEHQLGSGSVHTHQPVVQAPNPTPRHAHNPTHPLLVCSDKDRHRRAAASRATSTSEGEKKEGLIHNAGSFSTLTCRLSHHETLDFKMIPW